MKQLRKDYILDRWVYLSPKRKTRPQEFKKKLKVCYFCPGNEKLTPPEIGRLEEKGKWKIRWFPNKFGVVDEKLKVKKLSNKKLFQSYASFGHHEVIAETPKHSEQLFDLTVEHIAELLKVYSLRIRALSKVKGIKYVTVFKNHGRDAGTSLKHSHTQVAAIPKVPSVVMGKVNAMKKFKKCPYCEIISKEKKSKRRLFENKTFFSVAPFSSRFHYEALILPKKHIKNITNLEENEFYDLAFILKKILVKLKKLDCSYNFFLTHAPSGYDLHFHIEVLPRMSIFAGFEYSTGDIINSVSPEDAAKYYRSK